jgi:hypothetical protein
MKKISWKYHLKNEEVLQGVKEERNTLHTVKSRKDKSCEDTRKM